MFTIRTPCPLVVLVPKFRHSWGAATVSFATQHVQLLSWVRYLILFPCLSWQLSCWRRVSRQSARCNSFQGLQASYYKHRLIYIFQQVFHLVMTIQKATQSFIFCPWFDRNNRFERSFLCLWVHLFFTKEL